MDRGGSWGSSWIEERRGLEAGARRGCGTCVCGVGGVELDWCWRWASDGGWGAVGVDEGYGTWGWAGAGV